MFDIYGHDTYYIRKEVSKVNEKGEVLMPHHVEEMILHTKMWQGEIASDLKKRIDKQNSSRFTRERILSPTFLEHIDPERDFTNHVVSEQKTNEYSPFGRCWIYENRTIDRLYRLTVKKFKKGIII